MKHMLMSTFLSVSTAVNGAISDVKAQIKAIAEAIFPFLTGILGIPRYPNCIQGKMSVPVRQRTV